jgi:cobalt/nickel transport system ATP-binding protein
MNALLRIERLSYRYPDGTRALEDVSLEVARGERVALLGANGAGKSTLLWHLNGLLLSDGAVRLDGEPIAKSGLREVRRRVGLVFQNPDDQLFCATVLEDAAFGPSNLGLPEEEALRRARGCLAAVGLSGVAGRSAHHVSLGERKRAAIAAVLAMEPEVLALDEPTANLDPRGRREIAALLKGIGRTQVIATHDLGFAADLCGRAVVLAGGKVEADGPLPAILANRPLLERCGLA